MKSLEPILNAAADSFRAPETFSIRGGQACRDAALPLQWILQRQSQAIPGRAGENLSCIRQARASRISGRSSSGRTSILCSGFSANRQFGGIAPHRRRVWGSLLQDKTSQESHERLRIPHAAGRERCWRDRVDQVHGRCSERALSKLSLGNELCPHSVLDVLQLPRSASQRPGDPGRESNKAADKAP